MASYQNENYDSSHQQQNELRIPDLDYIKALLGLGETDLNSIANILSYTSSDDSTTNLLKQFNTKGFDSTYRNNNFKEMNCTLVYVRFILYKIEKFIQWSDLESLSAQCKGILHSLMEKEWKKTNGER